tara:strand:+ start:897 stop:1049 length:153 start_codon:yes stop_codon:yes gene_type:complete
METEKKSLACIRVTIIKYIYKSNINIEENQKIDQKESFRFHFLFSFCLFF